MSLLSIHLQAKNPELNIARAYFLTIERNLLAEWVLEIAYGRIGHTPSRKIFSFDTQEECLKKAGSYLRKRATSERRIGCAYNLIHISHDDSVNRDDILAWLVPPKESTASQTRLKEHPGLSNLKEGNLSVPEDKNYPPLPLFD